MTLHQLVREIMGNVCCCCPQDDEGRTDGDGSSETSPLLGGNAGINSNSGALGSSGQAVNGPGYYQEGFRPSSYGNPQYSQSFGGEPAEGNETVNGGVNKITNAEQTLLNEIIQESADRVIDCQSQNKNRSSNNQNDPGAELTSEMAEKAVEYGKRLSAVAAKLAAKHFPPVKVSGNGESQINGLVDHSGGKARDLASEPAESILPETDQVLVGEIASRVQETAEEDLLININNNSTGGEDLKESTAALVVPFLAFEGR